MSTKAVKINKTKFLWAEEKELLFGLIVTFGLYNKLKYFVYRACVVETDLFFFVFTRLGEKWNLWLSLV